MYRLVAEEGLSAYYANRRWDGPGAPVGEGGAALDLAAFRDAVRHRGAGGRGRDLRGRDPLRVVRVAERAGPAPDRRRHVAARVNYATHRARVRWDPARVDLATVLSRIARRRVRAEAVVRLEQAAARRAETRDLLVRLGTAGFLASQLMIYQAALYAGYFHGIDAGTRRLMEWISLGLTLPVYLYSGAPFLRATWAGLRRGRPAWTRSSRSDRARRSSTRSGRCCAAARSTSTPPR